MARGKASTIVLGAEERRELERLVRGRLTAQALAMRARIVLGGGGAASEGDTNVRIAERLGRSRARWAVGGALRPAPARRPLRRAAAGCARARSAMEAIGLSASRPRNSQCSGRASRQ